MATRLEKLIGNGIRIGTAENPTAFQRLENTRAERYINRRNDMLEALDRAAEELNRAKNRENTNSFAMRKFAAESDNDPFARTAYTGAVINTRRAAENSRDKTDDYLTIASRFDPSARKARQQAAERYDKYINTLKKAEPVRDSLNGRDSHDVLHRWEQENGKDARKEYDIQRSKTMSDVESLNPETATPGDYMAAAARDQLRGYTDSRIGKTLGGAMDTANAGYINAVATINDFFNQYHATPTVFNPDGTVNWEESVKAYKPSETVQASVNKMQSKADELQARGTRDIGTAKYGLGKVGQMLVDAGVSGTQMLGDAAINALVPGAGLTAMGIRAFGNAAQDARQRGADVARQVGYGAAVAGVEVLTEKMFDGLAGAYGKGFFNGKVDDVIEKVIKKLPQSGGGKMLLDLLKSAGEEGFEEFVSGIVDPAFEAIIDGGKIFGAGRWDADTWADILESMAVGALLGSLGGAVEVSPLGEQRASISEQQEKATKYYELLQQSKAAQDMYMKTMQKYGMNSKEAQDFRKDIIKPLRDRFAEVRQSTEGREKATQEAQPEGLTLPTMEEGNAQNARNMPAQEQNVYDNARNLPTEQYSLRDVPVPTYEQLIEKPDVPVVDVRRPRTGSFTEERAAFLDSPAAKQMYSAPVVNRDTGEGIFITPATIMHSFSNQMPDKIGMAEHLPEIVEAAVLTHAEQSRNAPDDHTTGVYTLFGAAQTSEGVLPVKLTVKEYNIEGQDIPATITEYLGTGLQPETFASVYDGKVLVLESIEKEEPSSSAASPVAKMQAAEVYPLGSSIEGPSGFIAPATAETTADVRPSGPSAISVKDLLALVKGDALKYVPKPTAPTAPTIENGGITNGNEGNAGPQPAGAAGGRGGTGVSDGGRGRVSGARAGEQTGGKSTSPELRQFAGQSQAAVDRRSHAKTLALKQYSPWELGISRGTQDQNLSVYPRSEWDTEMRDMAEKIKARCGCDVMYVLGGIDIRQADGSVGAARGAFTGKRIIIQCDHRSATVTQIGDHELYHALKSHSPGLNQTLKERILETYKEGQLEKVLSVYVGKLCGVYEITESMTEQEYEDAVDLILEELLADAYAGINSFGARANMFRDTVREGVNQYWGFNDETAAATDSTTGPPERYSYGGRNANGADSEALAEAERLEMQGLDPEDIRQETGWFRGDDGLWRYEIDDSGMEYYRRGDARFRQDHPEYAEYQQLMNKALVEEPTAEEWQRLKELDDTWSRESSRLAKRVEDGNATLENLIQHDALFEAYPQLRDIHVQFEKMEPGEKGKYNPWTHTITLDRSLRHAPDLLGRSLLHEIQHAIQEFAGFDRGTNPKVAGIDAYRNKAGEIEARDVAARRTMTQRERQATPPTLGGEQAVFTDGEDVGWHSADAYDPETASIKEQIENSKDTLNEMEVVASVDVPTQFSSKKQAVKWATELLKSTGYAVDRQDFGRIVFNPDDINNAMNYADTDAEKAAIAALPRVLKRGIEIGEHRNHKARRKQTVTIAAPVELNGTRGNMAVAVNRHGSHYYAHRILLPDGSTFVFSDNKTDTAQEPSRGVTVTGSLAKTTSAVSEQSIARGGEDVKGLSLPMLEDTERFSVDDEAERYIPQSSAEYARMQRNTERTAGTEKGTAKPVAESRPIIAKQELRQNLLGLFSIPDGMKAEVGSIIDEYADRIWKQGALTQADMDAFFDRMYAEGVMTVPADEYAKAGRDAVADGRIFVPERVKAEFGDDWNRFRVRAMAAGIWLTNDSTHRAADQWNAELAESFPGVFDENELDERNILEKIVSMAEDGKEQKMSLAEFAAMLSGQEHVSEDDILDNMERQMDWALRTFAEKAALEVRLRDRTGRKIAQEREKAARQMTRERAAETQRRAKERERRKELSKRQAENRELRELQQKTLKQLQWLNKNRQKAPADLRAVWDDVLGDIDLYAVSAANEMRWSKKYNATWRDLADMYKAASENDPNFLPSKELQQIVDRLDKDKIADMDPSALADLYKAAVGLRTEFYNRNNVINDEEHRAFADLYSSIKEEMAGESAYKSTAGEKLFNDWQLTPMNAMLRMAGWNKDSQFYSVARMLEQGERDMRRFTVNANAELAPFLTENEKWVRRADGQGKDAIWYELEVPELVELGMGDKPIFGKTVKVYMTPAQKVHMYLESKNYDNLRHMAGGRTFADKELYSKGKRREAFAQGTTVKLAPETVKKIVSDLTPEEMELARTLEHFYNETSRAEINRVSNALYGYDKAIGGSYAPIVTNQNYVKSEPGVFNLTAEGVGNLKTRQYSKNPSYNISAFDAFERSTDQTARFVGMAIPARNVNTLMNWRESDDSMRDVLTHKWGSKSTEMIDDLLTELQGGKEIKTPELDAAIDKALSKYISGVFGLNPSIVAKQFASYPLAAAYLGYANMPKWVPGAAQVDAELIRKYSGELAYRQLGYATPETALLKDNPGKLKSNGPVNFLLGGGAITWMDGFTVRTLWTWAENKVRNETELRPGTKEQIDAGTDEYYKAVAKEFEEAVSRSQPMYDVMHRSTVMRNTGGLGRAFTLFKTVPQQEYNMIREAFGELRYAKKSGADKATLKAAQQKAGRAISGIMLGNLLIGMITFLNALWKNRAKKYRDDEGELTAESVIEQFGKQYFSDSAGVILGGDVLSDILSVLFAGDKWYDLDAPGIEQINEIIKTALNSGKAMQKLVKDSLEVWNNDGDWGKYMSDHGGEYVSAVDELVTALGKYAAGLPTENVKGYLLGALSWMSPKIMTAYEDVMSNADKDGLKGLTGDALELRIGHVLNEHGVRVNDETAAALGKLYEAGMKSAIPTDSPTSVKFNSEDHKLNLAQQQTWDAVWSGTVSGAIDELTASAAFAEADVKTQAKMLDKLYDYATEKAKEALFDDYTPENATRTTERMMELGASMAEVMEAKTILADADKTADKVAALRAADLSDVAKGVAYYGLLASDKEREMLDELGAEAAAANVVLTNALLTIKAANNDDDMKGARKSTAKRNAIAASGLSDEQKAVLYRNYISDARDDDIKAFRDAGMSFDRFLEVQNEYAAIDELNLSPGEKATELSRWVNGQSFTKMQAKTVKDCFKYYSQVPQEASRYEKLLNAGLDDADAYKLTGTLRALEPEKGEDSVSDMQRYRAIAAANLSVQDKLAAMGTIMGTDMTTETGNPSQYAKMLTLLDGGVTLDQYLDLKEAEQVDGYLRYLNASKGRDYGISPEVFIEYRSTIKTADRDGSGTVSKAEAEEAIRNMGAGLPTLRGTGGALTNRQKAVLWQLTNKSWKPNGNPFDTTVGRWVYDALNA